MNQSAERWKKLYLEEAKNVLSLQKSLKTYTENISIHLEYISQLETNITTLREENEQLFEDYHSRLTEIRIEGIKNYVDEIDRIRGSKDFDSKQMAITLKSLEKELSMEKKKSEDTMKKLKALLKDNSDLQGNLTNQKASFNEIIHKLKDQQEEINSLHQKRVDKLIETIEKKALLLKTLLKNTTIKKIQSEYKVNKRINFEEISAEF